MSNVKQVLLEGRDAAIAAHEGEWRHGKVPDYHFSQTLMPSQRTKQHDPASLEAIVERLVQVFEMEISFKPDPNKWLSVVRDRFKTNVNGGRSCNAQELAERGSYNVLIGASPFYESESESFESSHDIFRGAFPKGFFWEVLEVYSPPPVVTVKWRHWGDFTGEYKGFPATNKRIDMFGMTVVKVSDDLQIIEAEHYYDNSLFLGQLTGGCPIASHKKA